jgi:hypothetical protein
LHASDDKWQRRLLRLWLRSLWQLQQSHLRRRLEYDGGE